MADDFDTFLSEALAPRAGEPDRLFVSQVQARIRIEAHLAGERRRLFSTLTVQVIGVVAAAAAAFWLLRSPAVASFADESPAILLLTLLAAFSFLIFLFGVRVTSRGSNQAFQRLSSLS